MINLQKCILKTLHYHSLFDYPLKKAEIWKFLIGNHNKQKISIKQFGKELKELVEKGQIKQSQDWFYLKGNKTGIKTRLARENYGKRKIRIAEKTAGILGKIPFVKMIAVTGSLAMDNCEKRDDIDFLIITGINRLWLTRFLAVLILEFLGKRRRPGDRNYQDKFCLNMFLDEGALKLSEKRRNLFTAHEIVQMKPLVNKKKIYQKFMVENKWVELFLPNAFDFQKPVSDICCKKRFCSDFLIKLLNYPMAFCLNLMEKLFYYLQIKYMRSKITNEDVSTHFAFFHPQDKSQEILERFLKLNSILDLGWTV